MTRGFGRSPAIVCVAMAMVLAACVTKHPADPDRLSVRTQALAPIEWPTLIGHEPTSPPVDANGLSRVVLLAHGLSGSALSKFVLPLKAHVVAERRDANGLLLALNIVPKAEWTVPADQRKPTRTRRLQYITAGPTLREAIAAVQADRANKVKLEPDEEEWGDLPADGVVFDLREPPSSAGEPRGVIIWYHSLGGLSFEEASIAELQRRGWLIAVAPFPWGMDADLSLILIGSKPDDLAPMARIAARTIDRRLAMAAYAAEAVRDYLYERSPPLRNKPLVVWGASAGSFCAPAVAARLGDTVKAAVLVGSGSNLLAVSQGSTFFDGGIKVQFPTDLRLKDQRAEAARRDQIRTALLEAYAKTTILDPVVTAPRLRQVPVLVLHGESDEIVPAKQGDELWELLGRPERWVFSTGHQVLFWRLSTHSAAIADWVDAAVATPDHILGQ